MALYKIERENAAKRGVRGVGSDFTPELLDECRAEFHEQITNTKGKGGGKTRSGRTGITIQSRKATS
jgi:hypothetical protein